MSNLAAVVVTYQSDWIVLSRLLDILKTQVNEVIVVDNGSGTALVELLATRKESSEYFLPLQENLGIATAQNRGISFARYLGASHVVLFDHDSEPSSDMIAHLFSCWERLTSAGYRVASVGPCYIDGRQDNPPPFIRVRGLRLARCLTPETGDAVSVDYLIASGCLIPLEALDAVGEMNSALFIDYVDIEWGQRARSKGYSHFGCFSAQMRHSLGDAPIHFFGTAYPARSPLRHYYMFRNSVLLYRMPHIPSDWKWADGLRGVLRFGFYVLFAKPRLQHLKMICLGILHGFRGKTGKFE